ncbi:MAG TPA: NUDIX domain-containing protein [Planctomycetota bacterium]|nr:NUDIX domain-containing protein [Planctomycetota bacterium]
MIPSLDIVRTFLSSHNPVDTAESGSLRRIGELVAGGGNPFSRAHYVPGHLTASGIVLNPQRTKTLLIFHTKLQRWLQPGGHFEPGENDPSVAAAREVHEETGMPTRWPGAEPVLLDVDVHVIPARKDEPAHEHFDLRMFLIAEEGQVNPNEVREAGWFEPRFFPELKLDPGTIRALKKVGLE